MRKGFTLVEIIVVIAIMSTIVLSSVYMFQKQRKVKSIETVANDVRNKFMEARSEAMSSADTTIDLQAVRVFYDATTRTLKKQYFQTGTSSTPVVIYTFPANITVINSIFVFNFMTTDGITLGNVKPLVCDPYVDAGCNQFLYGSGNAEFTIKSLDSTVNYKITINATTGNVTVVRQ